MSLSELLSIDTGIELRFLPDIGNDKANSVIASGHCGSDAQCGNPPFLRVFVREIRKASFAGFCLYQTKNQKTAFEH